MTDKEIYKSLKRDFFVKELEAKGIDCSGLSLEDVLILAEENNITGINDINPEPREKSDISIQRFPQPGEFIKENPVSEELRENDNTMNIAVNSVDECYKLLYDKLSSDEHIIPVDKYTLKQLINRAKEVDPELYNKAYSLYPGIINDNAYDSPESFMKDYAKEMDDEISKGREEIEKSKAYLENLLKSNGIDTKDLTYIYMLDLAAKLQKDLEPKEEDKIEETSEEKHIWDDSEISKDYKEEPSEPLMIKVSKEPEHTAIAEIQDLIKKVDAVINPKEEQLTRRQKIRKGFLVKELSLIESVDKEWLKNAPYEDIINKANEFPHIINVFGASPEFEEYKKITNEAVNKVIDFVAGRKDDMLSDISETKINENLWSNHFPGAINESKVHEVNKWLQEDKKSKEEKSSKHPSALLLNKSFMQGFLYSKTDLGILRLNNMSYSELLDECKKFVGFKNSLETRFDFIEDPEWTNTMSDIAKNACDCAEEYTSNDDALTIIVPKNEDILCSAIRNICEDYMCGLFPKSFETIAKSVESTRLQLTKEENSLNSNDDKMTVTFQGETTVIPYGNMLYNMICEVLWYQTKANLKLEYLGDVNILAHAVLGAINNPIVDNIDKHDVDRIKELIQALSLKFGINEPEYKKANTSDLSSVPTKDLHYELIKRKGVEAYWISPETSYTIDILNPTNTFHKALYFNGSGPVWIIFKKD